VHAEAQDAGGKDIVLHVRVPALFVVSRVVLDWRAGGPTAQRRSNTFRWTLYWESSW
jgi:hypothetical protein